MADKEEMRSGSEHDSNNDVNAPIGEGSEDLVADENIDPSINSDEVDDSVIDDVLSDTHNDPISDDESIVEIDEIENSNPSSSITFDEDYINESLRRMEEINSQSDENTDENTESGSSTNNDSYFDDDLLVLASDDEVIDESIQAAIIKQMEGIVTFRIEGFIDENTGEPRSKKELKMDPPKMVVESAGSQGDNAVEFMLTREFSKKLYESVKNVHDATYGVGKSKTTDKEIINWVSENKIKTGLLAAFVLMIIVMMFIQ